MGTTESTRPHTSELVVVLLPFASVTVLTSPSVNETVDVPSGAVMVVVRGSVHCSGGVISGLAREIRRALFGDSQVLLGGDWALVDRVHDRLP